MRCRSLPPLPLNCRVSLPQLPLCVWKDISRTTADCQHPTCSTILPFAATAGGGVDHGINEWNGVSGSDYNLSRGADTGTGFVPDGTNTLIWAVGNGCTGNCLALTALTLQAGQVIVESDITFK